MEPTERRKQHRYPITVHAHLTVAQGKESRVVDLRTRNVSSAGAFMETVESFCVGCGVRVELFIEPRSLLEIIRASSGSRIRVSGRVIRCTPEGVAVKFSKAFTIQPMSEMARG